MPFLGPLTSMTLPVMQKYMNQKMNSTADKFINLKVLFQHNRPARLKFVLAINMIKLTPLM